jgi:uncharacterized protein YjbI with pentapeptide repeats
MASKIKKRVAPHLDPSALSETFVDQLPSGRISDAAITDTTLPPLQSPRGQSVQLQRSLLRSISLTDPKAYRLHVQDCQIVNSDLANIDLRGSSFERVEMMFTRLTGAIFTETQFESVLFKECKLDFALFRMARLQQCAFENCNLTDADFYGADLSGTIFRDCDLSRADISQAKLAGTDIRGCQLDRLRGEPVSMDRLTISPEQAALLITLFGVRVEW